MLLDQNHEQAHTDRETQRTELTSLTARLVQEFVDQIPPGSIIRCVARCRESMTGIGVSQGLGPAVEGMARQVLLHRVPRLTRTTSAHVAIRRHEDIVSLGAQAGGQANPWPKGARGTPGEHQ
jgi:hypothetical protein